MKFVIALLSNILLLNVYAFAQSPNIGFENGTFDNWTCSAGKISPDGVISLNVTGPVATRHTIFGPEAKTVLDPYGQFPVLSPNGSKYSVRLGNDGIGAQAEQLSYTLTVPNNTAYSVLLNYAVVLENPGHLPYQQPKFTVDVYDVTDSMYVCPGYNFVAKGGAAGFKSFYKGFNDSVSFKDWSSAMIDLRNLSGKTIRLEFTTNDCTANGHFGYAYFDLSDDAQLINIQGATYCNSQNFVTLTAPPGFAYYQWIGPGIAANSVNNQVVTISPAPPNGTQYAVKVVADDDYSCTDTLYTVVNRISESFNLAVKDTLKSCYDTGADLTAPSVTAGSSSGLTFSYFRDSLQTIGVLAPNAVKLSGTYYIKGVNNEGCIAVLPVHVILTSPIINNIQTAVARYPAGADISAAFTHDGDVTYTYFTDSAGTRPLTNYNSVKQAGTYYIKATDQMGCSIIMPVSVNILPPLPYVINAPTAFTPNADGVNDTFKLLLTGYVSFGTINIYNRYGQLLYSSKATNANWDGTFKGKAVPEGVYYWIFTGTDDYYNLPVSKSGSIALIR